MVDTAESNTARPGVTDVTPDLLETWIASGDTMLVDVREDYEHAEERIDRAVLHALSRFDADALREMAGDRRIVFHCRTGTRSSEAAERFARRGDAVFHLEGGLEGWKATGRPVVKAAGGPPLPIMRQVQIAAGALVTLGVVLGVVVSPWLLGISAFVGCGLVFAGISGWCGMAKMLAVMPWNRTAARAPSPASSGA